MLKQWTLCGILLVTAMAPAAAAPPAINYFYVSSTGDCGTVIPCYSTIQAAVDAVVVGELNHVKVAAGTYSGVTQRSVNHVVYFQVVMITENLLLEGGYSTRNWNTPNPVANLTMIDATPRGSLDTGRCVTILGDGSTTTVTVDGFTLTGGDYSGLGNDYASNGDLACPRAGADCGGGLFVSQATINLRDSIVTGNTASTVGLYADGGGMLLWNTTGNTNIERCTFSSNSGENSGSSGGGLAIRGGSGATIGDCEFLDNVATDGGALSVFQPNGLISITNSRIESNVSSVDFGIDAKLSTQGVAMRLDRVTFWDNLESSSDRLAMTVSKFGSSDVAVEMDNVVFARTYPLIATIDNDPAVVFKGGTGNTLFVQARQVTAAYGADQTVFGFVALEGDISASFTNTLIDTAATAFLAHETSGGGITINHDYTLAHNVTTLHLTEAGTPTFNATNGVTGDPLLDANYRLQMGSAAIDVGVDSGVTVDIDGDPRPQGSGFDIGADELVVENPSTIFSDGFENGDTSGWSAFVP